MRSPSEVPSAKSVRSPIVRSPCEVRSPRRRRIYMTLLIEPMTSVDDHEWCARLMADNEPWITLKRDYAACHAALANPSKERYIVRDGGERAGLLILDMTGPFPGYIQSIAIAPAARNRGLGSRGAGVGRAAHPARQPERLPVRVVVQPRRAPAVSATWLRSGRDAEGLRRGRSRRTPAVQAPGVVGVVSGAAAAGSLECDFAAALPYHR